MSSLADLQNSIAKLYMYDGAGQRIQRPAGTIDFTFMANNAAHINPGVTTITALSSAWQTAFREAFALWEDVTNIDFREIAEGVPSLSIVRVGGADIAAPQDGNNYITFGANAVSVYGEISVDQNYFNANPTPGTYAWRIAVHEIGHTLSLADVSNVAGFPAAYNSSRYMTMSYDRALAADPATPMLWDIYAVQQIFGANPNTRTGDTTYGFNSNAGRQAFDFTVNTTPVVTLYDSGGYDTLDISGFSQNATVNLADGEYSSVAGLTDNIAIAFGTLIEAASGGTGNDTFFGNAADNLLRGNAGNDVLLGLAGGDVLRGGSGNDFLNGGTGIDLLQGDDGDDTAFLAQSPENDTFFGDDGNDEANYSGETAKITVSLGIGAPGTANGTGIGSDTLHDVENIFGGLAGDVLVGNLAANRIIGAGGEDLIVASDGNDSLNGGDGNDSVYAGNGEDSVDSGDGNDTIGADAGNDSVDGGTQFDTFDASTFAADATISLVGGFAQSTAIGNDQIANIERVVSGAGSDVIFGDGGLNILEGGGGNDVLRGLGGSDNLNGGAGIDTANFETETGAMLVNLAAGTSQGTNNGSDGLISIENVIAGIASDRILGSVLANRIEGRGGADSIFGGGRNDLLAGGEGGDRLSGDNGNDSLAGESGRDVLLGGRGRDTLWGGERGDTMTGGDEADRFYYRLATDSQNPATERDVITDFSTAQGDRIDLAAIDARGNVAGNQAFAFIGNGGFTSIGQLRVVQAGGDTYVFANTDVDPFAELSVKLLGVHTLTAADFIL